MINYNTYIYLKYFIEINIRNQHARSHFVKLIIYNHFAWPLLEGSVTFARPLLGGAV